MLLRKQQRLVEAEVPRKLEVLLGYGLGTVLVNDFIRIARGNGLRHLTCMLITDLEADAVETLGSLGFQSHIVSGYGTDPDGNQHDMTKMVLKL